MCYNFFPLPRLFPHLCNTTSLLLLRSLLPRDWSVLTRFSVLFLSSCPSPLVSPCSAGLSHSLVTSLMGTTSPHLPCSSTTFRLGNSQYLNTRSACTRSPFLFYTITVLVLWIHNSFGCDPVVVTQSPCLLFRILRPTLRMLCLFVSTSLRVSILDPATSLLTRVRKQQESPSVPPI